MEYDDKETKDFQKRMKIFISTPISEDFHNIRLIIENVLKKNFDIEIFKVEDIITLDQSQTPILKIIKGADLLIADITNNNPNIMLEVGYASGLGRDILFIIQENISNIPFDLRGNFILVYDPSDLDLLQKNIYRWFDKYFKRKMEREETLNYSK